MNAICPGFIDTDADARRTGKRLANHDQQNSAGYAGEANVGECVAFLASDGARYINGEVINVGGGMVL